jgi:glyoxylase-like metal-dependent hydrolase (beta-lactamase superfamily II)
MTSRRYNQRSPAFDADLSASFDANEHGDSIMEIRPANLSRRRFCLCCLSAPTFAATGASLTPRQASAEVLGIVDSIKQAAAKDPIIAYPLRGNVTVLEGSGGNIAVLNGRDGKLLVDAGIGVSRPQITRALADISSEPITHLISTHWHFDHTDGNAWVQSEGASILAHENTRTRLTAAQRVEDWSYTFPAPPPNALPTDVFSAERSMRINGASLGLKYYGPAHTDSDISVTFAEADIIHAADTFWNGVFPFIDYSTGGNIDGMIRATEANLAATTNDTIIIAGHGRPVGNRSQLAQYRDMLVEIRETVATLKRQGRPLDDILAARPTAAYDSQWGHYAINGELFTRTIFEGV